MLGKPQLTPSNLLQIRAMVALHFPIRLVDMTVAQPSLQLLSAFHTLEACALSSDPEETLDLLPLQNLPHLTKVRLTFGNFTGLEQLTGLTWLKIESASVSSAVDCKFVSSLRGLAVCTSTLHSLHQQGLSACSNLKHLALDNCKLLDSEGIQQLSSSTSTTLYPPCASKLTGLILKDDAAELQSLSTHWASGLSSLRSVAFELNNFQSSFVDSLFSFTNLTETNFGSSFRRNEVPQSKLYAHCLWHKLNALKRLSFTNLEIKFSHHSVASLLQVTSLTSLKFDHVTPLDSSTFTYLAAVLHQLARMNPRLEVMFEQLPIPQLLQQLDG